MSKKLFLTPYIGGKGSWLKVLLPMIEKCPHELFVEGFAGGANVFLNKKQSKREVINDLDQNLFNLYVVARDHREELNTLLAQAYPSRAIWKEAFDKHETEQDPIRRAFFFILVLKLSFGSNRKTYAPLGKHGRAHQVVQVTDAVAERLKQTNVECIDYLKLIDIYDDKKTLFFLDPPYTGTEKYYKAQKDIVPTLLERLKTLKGKFIVTLGDDTSVPKEFFIIKVNRFHSLSRQRLNVSKEVIVTNWEVL